MYFLPPPPLLLLVGVSFVTISRATGTGTMMVVAFTTRPRLKPLERRRRIRPRPGGGRQQRQNISCHHYLYSIRDISYRQNTRTCCHTDGSPSDSGFESNEDVNKKNKNHIIKSTLKRWTNINDSLFIFYAFVGTIVIPYGITMKISPSSLLTTSAAAAAAATSVMIMNVLTTLWMGFVLAISGMEAWMKFRAPFVPKPLLLDVGRTIFPALNSIEKAFCFSIWWRSNIALMKTTTTTTSSSLLLRCTPNYGLLLATFILVLQVSFLTPILDRRAKQTVYEYLCEAEPDKYHSTAFNDDNDISSRSLATTATTAANTTKDKKIDAFQQLKKDLEGKPMRSAKWHLIYVVFELVKIICLFVALL